MDRYTKTVLTVIAAALVALVRQQAFSTAQAQIDNCGAPSREPCAVYLVFKNPIGDWQTCLHGGKDRCKWDLV